MKFATSPAWTLKTRHERKTSEGNPGPGAYSPSPPRTKSSIRLGTMTRPSLASQTKVPGPGSYDPVISKSDSAPLFGTGKRPSLHTSSDAPGPGSYEASGALKGPKVAIKGKAPYETPSGFPGPGQYIETAGALSRKPDWSFGRERRVKQDKPAVVPGPGNYNPKLSSTLLFGRFSSAPKMPGLRRDAPGPGTYEVRGSLDVGGVSLLGRHCPSKEQEQSPGPGAYHPSESARKFEGGRFASAPKSPRWKQDSPGPGAYSPRVSKSTRNNIIGTSGRPSLANINSGPGPGTYELCSESTGPKIRLKGRLPEANPSGVPGPGQYQTERLSRLGEKAPMYSFPRVRKVFKISKKDVPGPGNYDPKRISESPKHRFKVSPRDLECKERAPGPGTYNIPSSRDTLAFSLTARHMTGSQEDSPGPGSYDPLVTTRAPCGAIGSAVRDNTDSTARNPGPGHYDARPISAPHNRTFSTSKRGFLHNAIDTPGPGTYETAGRPSVPRITLKGKIPLMLNFHAPGPGHYNADRRGEDRGVVFGSQARSDNLAVTRKMIGGVGPGMYHKELPTSNPRWSFGTDRKGPKVGSDVPGPGHYDIGTTIAVVAPYAKN